MVALLIDAISNAPQPALRNSGEKFQQPNPKPNNNPQQPFYFGSVGGGGGSYKPPQQAPQKPQPNYNNYLMDEDLDWFSSSKPASSKPASSTPSANTSSYKPYAASTNNNKPVAPSWSSTDLDGISLGSLFDDAEPEKEKIPIVKQPNNNVVVAAPAVVTSSPLGVFPLMSSDSGKPTTVISTQNQVNKGTINVNTDNSKGKLLL